MTHLRINVAVCCSVPRRVPRGSKDLTTASTRRGRWAKSTTGFFLTMNAISFNVVALSSGSTSLCIASIDSTVMNRGALTDAAARTACLARPRMLDIIDCDIDLLAAAAKLLTANLKIARSARTASKLFCQVLKPRAQSSNATHVQFGSSSVSMARTI